MPLPEKEEEMIDAPTMNKEKFMPFTAKEQRVIVRYLHHMKEMPTEIHKTLESVCGESAAPYKMVKEWIYDNAKGQEDIEVQNLNAYSVATNGSVSVKHNEPTDPALVCRIEHLVNKDRRIKLEKAAEMSMVSPSVAQHVLCDVLGMRKVNERWVPRLWTPEQRSYRVTIANELLERYEKEGNEFMDKIIVGDESLVFYFTPDKLRRVSNSMLQGVLGVGEKYRPTREQMRIYFTIFYDVHGIILAEPVPDNFLSGGEAYSDILKNHLVEAYTLRRKGKSLSDCILLHDNTAEHFSKVAQLAVRELGVEQLPHPPASPDLEPHEYWLIPHLKAQMDGKRLADRNSVIAALNHHIKQARSDEFQKSIRSLAARWAVIADNTGLYYL